MNTFLLGLRNAFRNSTRALSISVILGLSIGLCLVMLIAYQAVGVKIAQVKSSIGNTVTITPAGFTAFSDANNALTTDQLAKVAQLPHVTKLTETLFSRLTTAGTTTFGRGGDTTGTTSLSSPVILNATRGGRFFQDNGGSLPTNFSLPISIIGSSDPSQLNGVVLQLSSGSILNGSVDTNSALISSAMAGKNNLQTGSTFMAYNTSLTVNGIYTSSTQAGDNTIIVSLPTLQRLTGQGSVVTNAVATIDSLDNMSSATAAIKNQLGSSADVTSAQDQANAVVQPLQNVQRISFICLIGAIIAGGVIILLTMVMIVRERRREIGILKAIGASNTRVILQFMSEAITLTLIGALIGIVIGVIGGNPVTNMLVINSVASSTPAPATGARFGGGFGGGGGFRAFAVQSTNGGNFLGRNANSLSNSVRNISTNVGWNILGFGLGAALLIAVLGSAAAGWVIARVKPYEVMRAE